MEQENKIVPITKPVDDNQELKDMMSGNILQGLLGNGLEDKLPGMLSVFAPKAYDGIKDMLKGDKVRYMLYYDEQYGLILHKLDMDTTTIDFAQPTKEDIIIVSKEENGLMILKDGVKDNIGSLLKLLMGKMF